MFERRREHTLGNRAAELRGIIKLNPTSLYVLDHKLEFQRNLRSYLRDRYRIDTFDPPGILHLRNEEGQLEAMFPPFVEVYGERLRILHKRGDQIPPKEQNLLITILKDGIHRAFEAYKSNEPFLCIFVSGALPEPRPYVYPNAWDEIKVYDKIPPVKKYHRRKDPHTFLRPLTVLRQTGEAPVAPQWGRTDEAPKENPVNLMARDQDEYYFSIARATRERSTCLKTHTAALIVKDGHIHSWGINLCAPHGLQYGDFVEECPRMKLQTVGQYELCVPIHAEIMACLRVRLMRDPKEYAPFAGHLTPTEGEIRAAFTPQELSLLSGSTLYIVGNYYPCDNCVRFLKVGGITDIRLDKITGDEVLKKYESLGITPENQLK